MIHTVIPQDFAGPIEERCTQAIASGSDTILLPAKDVLRLIESEGEWRRRALSLVGHVGSGGTCRGCDAPILWVKHANGKTSPYDRDAESHWATCPKAAQFKARA